MKQRQRDRFSAINAHILSCDGCNPGEIGKSVRIGISSDSDRVLRFYLRGSPFVSSPGSLDEETAAPLLSGRRRGHRSRLF
jgi:3-methyladenine DNA glycosylase Mpg